MLSSLKQWHQVISTLLWKNKYFIIYCITYEEFLWYWMWILFFKSCSHCFPVNPLQPNISMYILHTVLFTSPKVLTRRICLTIKSFFFGDHSLYSHNLNVWFRGDFNLIICFDSLTVWHHFSVSGHSRAGMLQNTDSQLLQGSTRSYFRY